MLNPEKIISGTLSEVDFTRYCLEIFQYQVKENAVYQKWVKLLKRDVSAVRQIHQIPFLPVELFKTHKVVCGKESEQGLSFSSSSTTSQTPSKHYVSEPGVYQLSFTRGFELFYGQPQDFCILALLPNYLSRQGSSLVYMFRHLIEQSGHALSGFFLDDTKELLRRIQLLNNTSQKVLLLGVSYALLDLCEMGLELGENVIVMETGGMKGTRRELMKEELHETLRLGLKAKHIHSEYGMTELLSQAYSQNGNAFKAPPWMRFLIREIEDPFQLQTQHRSGGINVIDLANLHSCSFIATQDIGRIDENGQLQLLGRYDNSDVRGCNLMYGSEI
ncbi:MAG: acyl transferase [Bacteroidia bacterium]|nr:acyl transferase [Bacteroidia bacterium]